MPPDPEFAPAATPASTPSMKLVREPAQCGTFRPTKGGLVGVSQRNVLRRGCVRLELMADPPLSQDYGRR